MKSGRFKLYPLPGLAILLLGGAFNPWLIGKWLAVDGRIDALGNRIIIFIVEAALLGLGAGLLLWPRWFLMRWRQLLLAFASACCGVLLLEAGIRLVVAVHYHFFPPDRTRESYYGWVTQPNLDFTREQPGYGRIHFSTGAHGFRRWGDVQTARRHRLLALGDSYTEAATVSNGEAYYDLLARALPETEVFAYGCGGYGSLQEYLILDRTSGEIRPDLIVWQFCSNDLAENSVELEAQSAFNAHMRRPYLRGGKIEWLVPCSDFGFVYNLAQSSCLLRALCRLQYDAVNARRTTWLEKDYAQERPLCDEAAATTREIMAMAARRAGPVPIVAFAVNEAPWVGDAYQRACAAAGIDFIAGVPAAVEREKACGAVVDGTPADLHWNARGHAVAAGVILEHLRRNYAGRVE